MPKKKKQKELKEPKKPKKTAEEQFLAAMKDTNIKKRIKTATKSITETEADIEELKTMMEEFANMKDKEIEEEKTSQENEEGGEEEASNNPPTLLKVDQTGSYIITREESTDTVTQLKQRHGSGRCFTLFGVFGHKEDEHLIVKLVVEKRKYFAFLYDIKKKTVSRKQISSLGELLRQLKEDEELVKKGKEALRAYFSDENSKNVPKKKKRSKGIIRQVDVTPEEEEEDVEVFRIQKKSKPLFQEQLHSPPTEDSPYPALFSNRARFPSHFPQFNPQFNPQFAYPPYWPQFPSIVSADNPKNNNKKKSRTRKACQILLEGVERVSKDLEKAVQTAKDILAEDSDD